MNLGTCPIVLQTRSKQLESTPLTITIEVADNATALCGASYVREQVFGNRCFSRLPRLCGYDPAQILNLVARTENTDETVAALSVIETTGDRPLHGALELSFPNDIRVARYTQLAVLKSYRGLDLPARMIHEARRRFVLPNDIRYTWLLFNAETARASSFCRNLGFKCGDKVFATEYGCSRVLVREERNDTSKFNVRRSVEGAPPPTWNGWTNGTHPVQQHILP